MIKKTNTRNKLPPGLTEINRPVLDLLSENWTPWWDAVNFIRNRLERSSRSVGACLQTLRRNGMIEIQTNRKGRGMLVRKAWQPADGDTTQDDLHEPPMPTRAPRPTKHRPGSPQKIGVMTDRYERGEHLWHEADATSEVGREEEIERRMKVALDKLDPPCDFDGQDE